MKHHGAVEKCYLEQQFHKPDAITFVVWKTGALAIVEPGLMQASRLAGF